MPDSLDSVPAPATTDIALIGAGIMSATLGAILRRLEPDASITVIERSEAAGTESSGAWNNAGTGHAGLCELFYTPQRPDGSIDVAKAVRVNEQFQVTRQFWAYAVQHGMIERPRDFVHPIPHVSFVHGAHGVDYLRRRHDALADHPLFAGAEFITDFAEFAARLPLMAAGRDPDIPVALDWASHGTDVDFGALTRHLIDYGARNGTTVLFGHQVRTIARASGGRWELDIRDRRTGQSSRITAKFVFVGAGGASLPLLQRSGIPQARGFGGFPIGGVFLRSGAAQLTAGHRAKVYGAPAPGAPSTTAPHLDARTVDGADWLLFGPFAGWSPKFLKNGRRSDLARSIRPGNVTSLLRAGLGERELIGYLISQLRRTHSARTQELRDFVPGALEQDWSPVRAGQRVQVIRGGRLEFDTTIVHADDGSIAGLLGASPGASTAVPAMLEVLRRCFPGRVGDWTPTLREMVPSLGTRLADQPALFEQVWRWGTRALEL